MEVVLDIATGLLVLSSFGGVVWYVRGLEARLEKLEAVEADRED